tara:strand:- start:1119 stop:2021 length:903 start_codon:yes stop_codon:yes gene_type:complete
MAITVSERYEGRTSKVGKHLMREHTREFVAQSTANERSWAVAQAAGVPVIGDSHPEDAASLCVDIAVSPGGDPSVWGVQCKYTNDLPDADIADDDATSSQQPGTTASSSSGSQESWSFEEHSRFVTKDVLDKPILNTAGDRYEDPIEVVDCFPALTITKNKASFDPEHAYKYNNALNNYDFRGAAQGTLRVKITATQQFANDQHFWATTYTFRYNPNGWEPKILEAGTYQLAYIKQAEVSHTPCTVLGKAPLDSEPVDHPVPLDDRGKQIDPTTLLNDPSPVVYTEWLVWRYVDFNDLGV